MSRKRVPPVIGRTDGIDKTKGFDKTQKQTPNPSLPMTPFELHLQNETRRYFFGRLAAGIGTTALAIGRTLAARELMPPARGGVAS